MAREMTRRSHPVSTANPLALLLGVAALGAVAISVLAIGRLAIGRVAIKRARIGALNVDELTVRKLRIVAHEGPGALTDFKAIGQRSRCEASGRCRA
jgi:hypothetical protein